ncbi:hypothetical protein SELMODRAFT_235030 [Selaginella moellendorffii]|uniref:PPM-type phosphatase domain-containing protein n=1 Tax=Selaginella moellendorffii TaxID=88036 RepID=D8ST04_SELML|nr:probable protein phosphatase 2C 33 [Selaginella moellendorffii]EFJ12321.1 hypothetical protein SELMODRAFT_235030 [Selaginella moellendorffii]|eukprot:XP_002986464.1 probable protein phosphatase 2C 33 [Selaginella moellendorffii]
MGSCLSSERGAQQNGAPSRSSRKTLKREAKEVLAVEAKNDQQLACFPGRLCTNGSSNSCCLFSQQGRKGVNQDAMIAWESFASREDTAFCGVFDGHGPYGHLVARRVRDSLPLKLVLNWQESECAKNDEIKIPSKRNDEEGDEAAAEYDLFCTWKDLHLKAFKVMDRELQVHPSIDCFCSGTTAVTVLKQGQDLFIGNVGDSRAILGTTAEDGSFSAVPLTVDLKPNLPKEAERIRQCKGRVFALHDEPEVHRVWLPHENSPGLAMARAFGDFCLKDFGVIAVPEVYYRRLSDRDKFVVLATDGVWDVLSNEEVVNIISSHPTRSTAARTLVEAAVHAWMLKYPTSKIDDCAAVCLFLDTVTVSQASNGDNENKTISTASLSSARSFAGITVSKGSSDEEGSKEAPAVAAVTGDEKDSRDDATSKTGEEESSKSEWSALEGITRVNSLLSLPRFLLGDKRLGGSKRRR